MLFCNPIFLWLFTTIPRQPLIYLLSLLINLCLLHFYACRITHYFFLFVWVLVLSTVILKFINVVYINSISFFAVDCWVVNVPLYGYTIIHSPIDGNLSCFQFLAIKNKDPVNIHVQVFEWIFAFISFRNDWRNDWRMTGPYGRCVFDFLGYC